MLKKSEPSSSNKTPAVAKSASTVAKDRTSVTVHDITYADFRKLADKAPFSQTEWAAILHVSERTLQRYAKDNHRFAGLNAERFDQLRRLLKKAAAVFGSTTKFYEWLKNNPPAAEGRLSFSTLLSAEGIALIMTQLGRIEHGIFA